MKLAVTIALLWSTLLPAITLDLCQVYQPLSLHGTDVLGEFDGKEIRGAVHPRPMALGGAMPEALVEAIAYPHQFPQSDFFKIPESNLLVLCRIKVSAQMEEGLCQVTFDLSEARMPEEVELSIRSILKLGIEALEKTLSEAMRGAENAMQVDLRITGTKPENESLKDLGKKFSVR